MGTVFGAVICTHCRLLLPFPSPTWPLPFLVPLFASLVVLPCSLSFCLACRLVPPLFLASGCSRNFLPCLRLFFLLVVPVWLLLPALSRPYWPFFCSVATVKGSFVLFAFCLEAIATKLQLQPPQHPKNKTKQQQQQKKNRLMSFSFALVPLCFSNVATHSVDARGRRSFCFLLTFVVIISLYF